MHSDTRGVLLSPLTLELGRGQVPQRRVDPLAVVDLVEEPSQAPQRVAEVFVLREIDLFLPGLRAILPPSVHLFFPAVAPVFPSRLWELTPSGRCDGVTRPQPSVICSENSSQPEKKLESPRRFWNNRGRNTSSLFQPTEAFE
jgi:hypothetical protein